MKEQTIFTLKTCSSVVFNTFILPREQKKKKDKTTLNFCWPPQKLRPWQKLLSWWLNPIYTLNSKVYGLNFPYF